MWGTVRSVNIWTLTKLLLILAVYYSVLEMTLKNECELKVQTFIFNLRIFTSKSGVGITALFIIPSLFPHSFTYTYADKSVELISGVAFAFGICSCWLSIWSPKSCHCQWSEPSLGWKIETNPKTLGVAKSAIQYVLTKRKNVCCACTEVTFSPGICSSVAQTPPAVLKKSATKNQTGCFIARP